MLEKGGMVNVTELEKKKKKKKKCSIGVYANSVVITHGILGSASTNS